MNRRRFLYLLRDEAGQIVYIGQSGNVANRLHNHYRTATVTYPDGRHRDRKLRTLEWLPSVRSVQVLGPFEYRAALRCERQLIEQFQPRGNRMYTAAHGWNAA